MNGPAHLMDFVTMDKGRVRGGGEGRVLTESKYNNNKIFTTVIFYLPPIEGVPKDNW